MSSIQPNLEIPASYDKTFVLHLDGFMYCINVSPDGIKSGEQGECKNESAVLDWIEETLCGVRFECERLLK